MSVAGVVRPSPLSSFPIDLSWRNFVFALRTTLAGVTALAIAYYLEMQDPQWSILTVYLLAQPTAGAAIAKSTFRVCGTIAGAAMGLVILGLWSQAPIPFVGSVALMVGLCFYLGARLTNYTAYAFMLAGYTAMLIALEGAADPTHAWSLAADRTGEIVIGIVCGTAASVLILPRYAGVVLRESLAQLFGQLCHFGATALHPNVPMATFSTLRRAMVDGVTKFDALRSYAVFEAPELRADDVLLRRVTREFLRVLAVARGLFVRIEDFQMEGAGPVLDRLRPAAQATTATLERIAGDPNAFADPRRVRAELLKARAGLGAATAELEAMAGRVPFDPLADGLLILRRAGDLLHGLSMVMVSEQASLRARSSGRPRPVTPLPTAHREAMLIGLRSALGVILVCAFWAATEWTQGLSAATGFALILFFAVNQDRPGKSAVPVLLASIAAVAVAYAAMIFVLPRLEGYEALAVFLVVALIPGGLMAGTPQYAWAGIILAGFIGDEIGTGNVFQPDELTFLNANLAMVGAMAVGLVYLALFPVTSQANRDRIWRAVMGRLLPEAARGVRHERKILGDIVDRLAPLLPRLSLDLQREEDFLRGTLGAASMSLELGRLNRVRANPDLPPDVLAIITPFLTRFAAAIEHLPRAGRNIAREVDAAEAIVHEARAGLAALPLQPGTPGAALTLRAGASLRFISDRFDIDRAFLTRSFEE
ncbi:Fusaric acid resistance protein conserved region [Ancylobacter novellus DSM 506]|uniref:Fusaric acid resistance protein conserved region n=1 Tax=Ancylobacter novellus (strain ATCC 8093 / DSM 506 / JCM 20403 / CCM 1077 / IAM 12100 / NBRC 12443 / NCIMB 10456) TaxID=639283 RepID=D7A993_ANCN5|nr:FUSC family protein [Ancylobacter novellus]ADH90655.1 Fusaric acid resistance protein conserved region [Ancylobacter novellus DSM 506]